MRRKMLAAALGVVVVSACGGGGSPTSPTSTHPAPAGPNHPPVLASVTVSPSFGIADIQAFTFQVSASDPDGDSLAYLWHFGYGIDDTETRASFVATYYGGAGGLVTITVRVTDPSGAFVERSATITLGSVSGGLWTFTNGPFKGGAFGLVQDEHGVITGKYALPTSPTAQDIESGRIDVAGNVTLVFTRGSKVVTLRGRMDHTGMRITGTMSGGASGAFTLTKGKAEGVTLASRSR